MNVFNQEFVTAIKAKLDSLEPLAYLTREQICAAIGVDKTYVNAVSIVMQEPQFADYEAVKSRGIRRKKISAAA